MTEIQIAWLELMTVGGLGVILVLLGVTFNIIVKRQNQLCTKQTDGIVKQCTHLFICTMCINSTIRDDR